MHSRNSDPSGIEKSIARNVEDANESAASNSQMWHQNENNRSSIEKPMAKEDQRSRIEKSIAKVKNRLTETRLTHHNFTPYLGRVFANIRQKSRRRQNAGSQSQWENLVNIHVSDNESSNSSRIGLRKKTCHFHEHHTDFEQLKTLFDVTRRLVLGQRTEINGISLEKIYCAT